MNRVLAHLIVLIHGFDEEAKARFRIKTGTDYKKPRPILIISSILFVITAFSVVYKTYKDMNSEDLLLKMYYGDMALTEDGANDAIHSGLDNDAAMNFMEHNINRVVYLNMLLHLGFDAPLKHPSDGCWRPVEKGYSSLVDTGKLSGLAIPVPVIKKDEDGIIPGQIACPNDIKFVLLSRTALPVRHCGTGCWQIAVEGFFKIGIVGSSVGSHTLEVKEIVAASDQRFSYFQFTDKKRREALDALELIYGTGADGDNKEDAK